MEAVCVICGKEIKSKTEGDEWRYCYFCKKPVCFDDIRYIGIWKEGLYQKYVEVIPVCKKCKPKKL
ncbi:MULTISPECIES: hypothetical protein [Archaeoglobus]|jgi:tRNA(Ile2) C34 agmatinyltransferase TiaS|nr:MULTISPECIES: hypothetical protein [Archaeoglobus]